MFNYGEDFLLFDGREERGDAIDEVFQLISQEELNEVLFDFVELLNTSASIHDIYGNIVYSIQIKTWCKLVNTIAASVSTELPSPKECINSKGLQAAALKVIKEKTIIDVESINGVRIYSIPLYFQEKLIGVISFSYPDISYLTKELKKGKFNDLEAIKKDFKQFSDTPEHFIHIAKKRIQRASRMISSMLENRFNKKELDELSKSLTATLNSIGDAVIATDLTGRIRLMNAVAEKLTGWHKNQAIGMHLDNIFRLISSVTGEKVSSPFDEIVKKGEKVEPSNHTILLTKDNRTIPISDNGSPILNHKGVLTGVVIVFRDETEYVKRRSLQELRLRLFEYGATNTLNDLLVKTLNEVEALTGSEIGFYHYLLPDEETLSLQAWSSRTKDIYCSAKGEGLHYNLKEAGIWVEAVYSRKPVIHNDFNAIKNKKGMPEGHVAITRELIVPVLRDNKVVALLGVGNKSTDYTEEDAELVSYIADVCYVITQEKRIKYELIESNRKYHDTIENLNGVVYRCRYDEYWTMDFISDGIERLSGYKASDFINNTIRSYASIIHPDDREITKQKVLESINKGEYFTIEYRIITAQGIIKWVWEKGRGVKTDEKIEFLEGYIEDITSRKEAERALSESEEHFRLLFNQSADGILVGVDDGEIIQANEAICKMTGYLQNELIGKNINILFNNNAIHSTPYPYTDTRLGESTIQECLIKTKLGTLVNVEMNTKILSNGRIQTLFRNISERKRQEERLMLLSKSVEQSPVSVVITNKEGYIVYANSAFSNVTGYSIKEAYGKNPRILKSGDQSESFYKEMWDTLTSGKIWYGEFKNKKKNGEYYIENAVITPIKNEFGEISHYVAVKEDVTDKRNMIRELVAAKNKAEESDRLKTAFLANMSHEIRTPMNGIIGFLDLLQNPDLSLQERENYIEIVRSSGNRLLTTINDIIEISKIESGLVEVNDENINLTEILNYFYNFFKPEARKKQIDLILKNNIPEKYSKIRTDRIKLESILTNYIKNALKFTQSGSIVIGAEIVDAELNLYVKDTGTGIKEDRQKAVFERFIQAELGYSRPHEGSGLGLSICKAYANLLGGTVGLDSEYGKGSTFYFKGPVTLSDSVNKMTFNTEFNYLDGKGRLVLVAEDDDNSFEYMQILLKSKGFRVVRAENGVQALKEVRSNREITIVLMDIKMPEMDGYEATRQIRTFNHQIPIIAQTAYALDGDSLKAIEVGCTDYVTKPIDEDKLFNVISRILVPK